MSEENVDIRKTFASYLGIVYRGIAYWKWGLLVCFLVTTAGTAYAASQKKVWDSRTRIRVVTTRVTDGYDGMNEDVQEELRNRLKAFISADRYLQDVIDEFGLYRDIKSKRNWTDIEVLDHMRAKIDYGVHKGDEFTITFFDHDPRVAQAVTHKIAENFMSLEKGSDYNVFRTKLEQTESQLERLLKQRDAILEEETQFRRSNAELIKTLEARRMGGGIGTETTAGDPAVGSEDTTVTRYDSPQLKSLRLRLRDLEETASRMRSRAEQPSGRDTAINQQRTQAQADVNRAKMLYDRLRAQYTEQHPDLQGAKTSLARAEARQREVEAQAREVQRSANEPSAELSQVQREIKKVRDDVRRQASIDRRKATAEQPEKGVAADGGIAGSADGSAEGHGEIVKLGNVEEVESALKRMKTKVEPITQQIQELDAQRLKLQFQTEQREQGGARQYVIIDPARIASKASGPPRTRIALMSGFGGIFMGCAIMILIGFLDSRLYRPSDLGRLDHIQLLTTVADFEDEVKEILAQASYSQGSDYEESQHNQQSDG